PTLDLGIIGLPAPAVGAAGIDMDGDARRRFVGNHHLAAGGLPMIAEYRIAQPAALEAAADLGPPVIDGAAAARRAMHAPDKTRLVQRRDAQQLAAQRAAGAGAAGRGGGRRLVGHGSSVRTRLAVAAS